MRPRSRGARGRTTRGAGSDDTRGPSLLASPEPDHGRLVLTGNDEQRDSTAAPSAGGPGPLSRLLQELADASGDDVLEAWKNELHPGERLGRFEIQREIGRGGFGAVYQAFDTELGRVVAVKTLRLARKRHELSLDWIKKEAEAVARLDHPCIVTLFDVGTCDSGAYLVMELLHGNTLAQRIAEGPIPVAEALRIAEEMARGLAHAHQRGVLHRDLKPANTFLGDDGRVKLLDFGLAHLLGTHAGSDGGTPAYMAPEQAAGATVDQRADVFAAGKVLGDMLGERPPRRLARAIAASTSADPSARPRDGTAWLEALQDVRGSIERPSRLRRVALLAGAFSILGVLVAGLAAWIIWRRQFPVDGEGRVTVAVADFANETQDPDLDGLSGLLSNSLEQSRVLRVLTRSRMWDLAREEGKASAERMDEPLARVIGRKAAARALLLASVRRLDDTYVVEMRALDPRRDEYLFTANEQAPSKKAILALVERLASRTRSYFRDLDSGAARAVTGSLEAYRHYFEGMRCLDRSAGPNRRCLPELEKAIAIDPDFALAHFRLAQAGLWSGVPLAALKDRMSTALRNPERLPPKERAWVEAFAAQLDGREDEAARLFGIAAEAGPDDRHVQTDAADFFLTRNEPELALPFLRRAFALEPSPGSSAIYLAIALGALGRREDLGALARSLEAGPQVKGALVALTAARVCLGDREGALASARAAVAASADDVERGEAGALLDSLRMVQGDPALDAEIRSSCSTIDRAILETARGRYAEARRVLALGDLAGCPPPDPGRAARSFYLQALGADVLAGMGDPEGAWPFALRAAELNPLLAGSIAVQLAYAGDLEHAAQLAVTLHPGSPRRRTYEAVVRWRQGDRAGARALLEGVNGYSSVPPVAAPAFLLGELLSEMGEHERAVEALRRYRTYYFVHLHCAAWELPKSSFLLARSLERLGRRDEALLVLDEQLAAWKDADPDIPMLAEARTMQARMATSR